MKTLRQVIAIFFMTGLILISQSALAQKQTKEINKTFQVNNGSILEIENKFGDIDIMQWDKSEVSISVKLSATARNDASAISMIDKISIEINKESNNINARTVLNNESGMRQGNTFTVNYTVNVPKWINLNLVNKFGNIHIDDISGIVNIDLKHGDLSILTLSRGNFDPLNQIFIAYSNGVIENAGSIKLDLSFSKLKVEAADFIDANTKYSGINVNSCNSYMSESKYDNFKFDKIRNLEGNLKYSNLHIVEFSGKLEMESIYSGVRIDQVLPSFENMKITNERGAYKIGISPETSFDLYADSERGEISVSGFNILEKKTDGSNKFIHATNGTKGTNKIINISLKEGSLSLFKM